MGWSYKGRKETGDKYETAAVEILRSNPNIKIANRIKHDDSQKYRPDIVCVDIHGNRFYVEVKSNHTEYANIERDAFIAYLRQFPDMYLMLVMLMFDGLLGTHEIIHCNTLICSDISSIRFMRRQNNELPMRITYEVINGYAAWVHHPNLTPRREKRKDEHRTPYLVVDIGKSENIVEYSNDFSFARKSHSNYPRISYEMVRT